MFSFLQFLALLGATLCAPGAFASPGVAQGPRVLVASSLREVAQGLDAQWQAEGGEPLVISTAASGDLARQVIAGARADLILSADIRWMLELRSRDLLTDGSATVFAQGGLCVVAPKGAAPGDSFRVEWIGAGEARLPLPSSEAVPLGRYAKRWLESIGRWQAVEGRITGVPDARAALAAVEAGAAPMGIVYLADARRSDSVEILYSVPLDQAPAVEAALGLPKRNTVDGAGTRLRELLLLPAGAHSIRSAGLEPLQRPLSGEPDDGGAAPGTHPSVLGPVLWVSIKVALAVVLLDFFPALAMAWLLARRRFWGRSVLEALVHLPLILPPTAVGWLLLLALGKGGPLGSFDLLLTFPGAVLAGGVVSFPLFVRPMRAALEGVDPRLESMARSLGLGPLRAFCSVTLPLAARGIGAGVLLGMGRALGEFGATVLVAGSLLGETRTLSMAVFEAYQLHDDRGALQLVGVCGLLAFVIVFAADRLGSAKPSPPSGGTP